MLVSILIALAITVAFLAGRRSVYREWGVDGGRTDVDIEVTGKRDDAGGLLLAVRFQGRTHTGLILSGQRNVTIPRAKLEEL